MRHGKSSWEYDVSDRERPLKSRGKNDAKLVANQYIKNNILPRTIFTSPAKRALDTCMIFCIISNFPTNEVKIEEDLYDFGGESVINFIKNLPNDISEIMIFGHNHAFTSISNIFGSDFISNLPTSGLVKIRIDIDDWKSLKKGKTIETIIPKELR
jgi:phosphohistidine phosphatase